MDFSPLLPKAQDGLIQAIQAGIEGLVREERSLNAPQAYLEAVMEWLDVKKMDFTLADIGQRLEQLAYNSGVGTQSSMAKVIADGVRLKLESVISHRLSEFYRPVLAQLQDIRNRLGQTITAVERIADDSGEMSIQHAPDSPFEIEISLSEEELRQEGEVSGYV